MNMMLLYRVLAWASVAAALVGFGYVRGLVADQTRRRRGAHGYMDSGSR